MTVRSGLLGFSFVFGALGALGGGLFTPNACVSPAVLIALTAIPTDALGEIVVDKID